jgi:hypothetical protein
MFKTNSNAFVIDLSFTLSLKTIIHHLLVKKKKF